MRQVKNGHVLALESIIANIHEYMHAFIHACIDIHTYIPPQCAMSEKGILALESFIANTK